MQFRSLHSVLPSGCLGVSDVLLLNDGDMIALYEHAFGFGTGDLGPCCCCQPAFEFRVREAFLDRPSQEATAAAQVLLAEAIRDVLLLDWSHDRGSYDAILLPALRRLLDGASPRRLCVYSFCLFKQESLMLMVSNGEERCSAQQFHALVPVHALVIMIVMPCNTTAIVMPCSADTIAYSNSFIKDKRNTRYL
jgi:hypothetical protein